MVGTGARRRLGELAGDQPEAQEAHAALALRVIARANSQGFSDRSHTLVVLTEYLHQMHDGDIDPPPRSTEWEQES